MLNIIERDPRRGISAHKVGSADQQVSEPLTIDVGMPLDGARRPMSVDAWIIQ